MDSEQAKMRKAMERQLRLQGWEGVRRVSPTNNIPPHWSAFVDFPPLLTPPRPIRTQSDAYVDHFADLKRKRAETQAEADLERELDDLETRKKDRQVIYEVKIGKLTVKIIEDGNGDLDHEVYEGDVQVIDY